MIEISFTSCNLFQLHGCRGYVCPNIALALYFEIILKNCWKRPMAVCLSLAGSVPAGTLGAAPRAWPWTGREPWPSLASPTQGQLLGLDPGQDVNPGLAWRAPLPGSNGGLLTSQGEGVLTPRHFLAPAFSQPAQSRQRSAWWAIQPQLTASTSRFTCKLQLPASTFSSNSASTSSFNFQLQLPASTSKSNFQLQLPASTSSFNSKLHLQASTASFTCKLQRHTSIPRPSFTCKLPLPASTSSFHFQLPLPASTSKSNFQI